MEYAEVGKFFNGINDTDVFVPIEYNVLCKALDMTPFLRQLQQMISTPLPELPADVAAKAGGELPSGSPALATRKRRAIGQLFNFETVARRKWLKNMLLELDGQEEADRLTGDDLDVILKIHKYRRSVQRDCLVDILNSQYLYYSSGLMSEYDRYPEHRKFILDQYGYNIPMQQTTTAFKPASTRKRRTSTKAGPGAAAKATGGGRGSQTILNVVDSVLSCPCSPNTCRCASLKQTFDTSVDPVVFHLWNVIAVHEFPKAHQQWRVATIYRQSVLKNLAVSSVAYLNRSLEKGHHERGDMGHFKPMTNLIRHMTRSRVVVDGAVEEAIRNGSYKPRHHPGRTAGQIVDLDQRFTAIANHIVSYHQLKSLKATAQRLYCVLSKRQLPLDIEELSLKRLEVEEEIVEKLKTKFAKRGLQWPPEEETDEERERRLMMLKQKVNSVLQSRVYHWKPMLYDTEAKCASYMLARLLPNYAVAVRVLGELKRRMKEFEPKTIFDFASGVGSCYMACRHIWPDCIREVFMVDTSSKMNDLALRFMDSDDGQKVAIAVRQFLPALSDRPYDLVFAAYALMETADWEQRRLLLENLWQKSDKFLVLIEYGSKAGHRVLMEARHYLLDKFDNCTVFSPCPHEMLCPRLADSTPCNFAASYVPLRLPNAKLAPELELYSYVTLRKVDGTEPKQPPWPRVVRTPLRRRKHIWCDLCTSSGSLQRVLFTKTGSGQHLYRIAKATAWGDLMPVVGSAAPEQTS